MSPGLFLLLQTLSAAGVESATLRLVLIVEY